MHARYKSFLIVFTISSMLEPACTGTSLVRRFAKRAHMSVSSYKLGAHIKTVGKTLVKHTYKSTAGALVLGYALAYGYKKLRRGRRITRPAWEPIFIRIASINQRLDHLKTHAEACPEQLDFRIKRISDFSQIYKDAFKMLQASYASSQDTYALPDIIGCMYLDTLSPDMIQPCKSLLAACEAYLSEIEQLASLVREAIAYQKEVSSALKLSNPGFIRIADMQIAQKLQEFNGSMRKFMQSADLPQAQWRDRGLRFVLDLVKHMHGHLERKREHAMASADVHTQERIKSLDVIYDAVADALKGPHAIEICILRLCKIIEREKHIFAKE